MKKSLYIATIIVLLAGCCPYGSVSTANSKEDSVAVGDFPGWSNLPCEEYSKTIEVGYTDFEQFAYRVDGGPFAIDSSQNSHDDSLNLVCEIAIPITNHAKIDAFIKELCEERKQGFLKEVKENKVLLEEGGMVLGTGGFSPSMFQFHPYQVDTVDGLICMQFLEYGALERVNHGSHTFRVVSFNEKGEKVNVAQYFKLSNDESQCKLNRLLYYSVNGYSEEEDGDAIDKVSEWDFAIEGDSFVVVKPLVHSHFVNQAVKMSLKAVEDWDK